MSMANTRLRRCTQAIGASGLSASTLPAPRHDPLTVLEVRREHAMEAREIQARPGHQGRPACDPMAMR